MRGLVFEQQIVHNFQSLGDVTIPLDKVGMVAIRGRNLDDSSAQENGVGKTTLLDSIVCTLYGRIPRYARPVKGSQVINRHNKSNKCTLQLKFSIEKNGYLIHREYTKRGHVLRLYQDGADISEASIPKTQDKLCSLVGTYQAFLNSIMFGRGVISRFVKSDAVERGEIIASLVMDTEQLDDARRSVEKWYSTKQAELSSLSEKLESAKILSSSKKQELQSIMDDLKQLQIQNIDKLRGLKPPKLVKNTTKDLSKKLQKMVLQVDRLKRKQDIQKDQMNFDSGKLKEVRSYCDILEILDDAHCPVCSTKLSKSEKSRLLHQFNRSIKELDTKYGSRKSKIYVLRDKIYILENKISKLREEKQQLQDKLVKYTYANMYYLSAKSTASEQEAKMWERLTHAKVAYSDSCFAMKLGRGVYRGTKQEVRDLVFLRKAFSNKGIMAEVVKTVCPKLTVLSQSFVTKFLGGGYKIEFLPELVKVRGEERLSFSIHASVEKGGEQYAACSDGEQERIDTCVGLALRYLVASRFHQRVNLLAFDERFSGLDMLGSEKVMELITEEAKKQSSVLVITHQEHLQQFFQQQWVVVKENGVARLETS